MKIKLLNEVLRPNCCAGMPGEELDVPANFGEALVDRGDAVSLEPLPEKKKPVAVVLPDEEAKIKKASKKAKKVKK